MYIINCINSLKTLNREVVNRDIIMEFTKAQSTELKNLISIWLSNPTFELECGYLKQDINRKDRKPVPQSMSVTTFQSVAQRLKDKGFESDAPQEYLNIITPGARYTVSSRGLISQYCKTESLKDISYTCMMKSRTPASDGVKEAKDIEMNDYDIRIRLRNEVIVEKDNGTIVDEQNNWDKIPKMFRLIKRWSYRKKDDSGVQYDLSIVRMNRKFQKTTTFQQADIMNQHPQYEVEVEVVRSDFPDPKTPVDYVLKRLIAGIGNILRGIQQNALLITNSLTRTVILQYLELVKNSITDKSGRQLMDDQTGTIKPMFRGCAPVTLERKNMQKESLKGVPNIRENYFATDKADGLRVHCYINPEGHLYLIDMNLKVYRTGLSCKNRECANTLLDAEWITKDKENNPISQCMVFDIYYCNSADTSIYPFYVEERPGATDTTGGVGAGGAGKSVPELARYKIMSDWFAKWNADYEPKSPATLQGIQIFIKRFEIATGNGIFSACKKILDSVYNYHTDGLILTANNSPLPSKANDTMRTQFKWKPAQDNTVDFLVKIDKIPETGEDKVFVGAPFDLSVRYKKMNLYIGSTVNRIYNDPRNTILMNPTESFQEIINEGAPQFGKKHIFTPVLFNPENYNDSYSAVSNAKIINDNHTGTTYIATENTEEPIMDDYIVEMRYDFIRDNGWKWVPIRVRHDKTERYLLGKTGRTMNAEVVANSVWESIHNPITHYMITTGSDAPSDEEYAIIKGAMKFHSEMNEIYYEVHNYNKDIIRLVDNMRNFHNEFIKKNILNSVFKSGTSTKGGKTKTGDLNLEYPAGSRTLIDYSCGRANDIHRWIGLELDYVLGIDIASDNIMNKHNGAYSRYLKMIIEISQGVDSRGKPRRGAGGAGSTSSGSIPIMIFVNGDSSKPIVSGEAGITQDDKAMLKYLFGDNSEAIQNAVPPYLKNIVHSPFKATKASAGVCMFSLHYFFKNKELLTGLLDNIETTIENEGYFGGCCFEAPTRNEASSTFFCFHTENERIRTEPMAGTAKLKAKKI